MTKNIGILGFGIVGKSALEFFGSSNVDLNINIWDQRELNESEKDLIKKYNANYFFSDSKELSTFIKDQDKVITSPGFCLDKLLGKDYQTYKKKIICELDLFSQYFKKDVVGITGTLGKTTITTLLKVLSNNSILNNSKKIRSKEGGNIGNAMLSLVKNQESLDLVFLELSSFQLNYSKEFAPKVAIFNNFYPNHLDWHGDMSQYLSAKLNLFRYQKENQYSIFSSDFLSEDFSASSLIKKTLPKLKSKICFICSDLDRTLVDLKDYNIKRTMLFYEKNEAFFRAKFEKGKIFEEEKIFNLNFLPDISFKNNWFFVLATMSLLGFNISLLQKKLSNKKNDFLLNQDKGCVKHRLELFTSINGIDFYNDSKATVIEATKKAIEKLDKKGKPIILILGGLSKGVDRSSMLDFLSGIKNLKKVFCFGPSCGDFKKIPNYSSLELVINATLNVAKFGDQVLFSPSGSSFDLFDNYQHRGDCFKKIVLSSK